MTKRKSQFIPYSKVATYEKRGILNPETFFSSQFEQVGQLVDMWADLLEGFGDKIGQFAAGLQVSLELREIERLDVAEDKLKSSGFFPVSRKMGFCRRDEVTLVVYVAKQGKDLYVSWRAFIQAQISPVKIAMFAAAAVLLALIVPYHLRVVGQTQVSPFMPVQDDFFTSLINFTATIVVYALVIGLFVVWRGFFYNRGDFLALVREPLNELQVDDIASLANAVHKSVLFAAEQIGVDVAKLEKREPFYAKRRKPLL